MYQSCYKKQHKNIKKTKKIYLHKKNNKFAKKDEKNYSSEFGNKEDKN